MERVKDRKIVKINYMKGNDLMNKLRKCEADRKICGVCSGVARYLNIDTTAVRLIWALLSFSGFGIAAYIVAALIMPSDSDV